MYKAGDGVPQDYKKAMEYYLQAADQGDSDAQYSLGIQNFIYLNNGQLL